MIRTSTRVALLTGLILLAVGGFGTVGAQNAPPDFTKFGYPTVAKSMDIAPDQMVTVTAGDQSVTIRPGTFDVPVTFDLLTSDPATWKDQVKDRTVRAAFAFRVTDKNTKAIIGQFKQPVMYSYSGAGAQGSDAILNTSAATPPAITPNATPITFDGKVNHPFGGAGVGWLVVSAPSGTGTAAPAAPATGGGTASTAAPVTLPKTGMAQPTGTNPPNTLLLVGGAALIISGSLLLMRRRTVRAA